MNKDKLREILAQANECDCHLDECIDQILSLHNEEMREMLEGIMSTATKLGFTGQVVGEDNEYYITLAQLEFILKTWQSQKLKDLEVNN